MPYFGAEPASELANLDINGQKFILDADADTSITSDTDDQIDIEIAGADDFQFTANTFTAQSGSTIAAQALTATTVNASGVVGVISAHDLGTGLHIKTADSGASVDADADELVIEGSAHSGLSILSGATSKGGVLFADSGDADAAQITYDHNTEFMAFNVGGNANPIMFFDDPNQSIIFQSSGGSAGCTIDMGDTIAMYIGSTDASNASMTRGITINQSDTDNEIFALKSTDVAHPFTDLAEADTYLAVRKNAGTTGGALFRGFNEATTAGLVFHAYSNSAQTDDTTGSQGSVMIKASITDGSTGATVLGDTGNILTVINNTTTRVLFKGDGTVHASDTSWATALDEHDDMLALRMLDKAQSTSGIIDSAWDSMIGTDWEYLQKIGVAGSTHPEKGRPDMFSIQGIQKLTMGATWYLGQNFMAFLETVEKRMPGIRKEFEDHMLEQSGRPAMLTQAAN
jgi:hypothetical protein